MIPSGTPYMANHEVVTHCTNPRNPELCPACGHTTLFTFTVTILHDDGAVPLPTFTACGSEDCADPE